MYASLNRRFEIALEECIELLQEMAPARIYPDEFRATTPSLASSPSLRSKDSVLVPMTSPVPPNAGGNVKVVVRVRGFLQRGTSMPHIPRSMADIVRT
jgi:hypothetical protein